MCLARILVKKNTMSQRLKPDPAVPIASQTPFTYNTAMDFRAFSPCFLVAMPDLKDPNFEKSVVLLSDYTPEGALGFVVNRPSASLKLGSSVTISQGEINPEYGETPLWTGGPVDPQKIWVLYDRMAYEDPQGVKLADGVNLARDIGILLNHEKTLRPEQMRIIHGYAGWGQKQLEAEITSSLWITAPISRELLFLTAPEHMWNQAIRGLGIDATRLVSQASPFLN